MKPRRGNAAAPTVAKNGRLGLPTGVGVLGKFKAPLKAHNESVSERISECAAVRLYLKTHQRYN